MTHSVCLLRCSCSDLRIALHEQRSKQTLCVILEAIKRENLDMQDMERMYRDSMPRDLHAHLLSAGLASHIFFIMTLILAPFSSWSQQPLSLKQPDLKRHLLVLSFFISASLEVLHVVAPSVSQPQPKPWSTSPFACSRASRVVNG